MITNRSSLPRLLRKSDAITKRPSGSTEKLPPGPSTPLLAKGNKTGLRKPDNTTLRQMVQKGSGSQTHSNLTTEPSLKAMRAPKKQLTDGLPKSGAGFGLTRNRGSSLKRATGGSTSRYPADGGPTRYGGTAQESWVQGEKKGVTTPLQSASRGKSIKAKQYVGKHAFGNSVRSTSPTSDWSPGTSRSNSPNSSNGSNSPLPDFNNMVADSPMTTPRSLSASPVTPPNTPRTPRPGTPMSKGGKTVKPGIKKIPAMKIPKGLRRGR